ncbi:MAG: FmdB family zinc ribbon protein [Fimbriimonadaceae bacterium]
MPIYVYECASCSKQFEIEQRITEDALKDCSCGAAGKLRRLIQPIAVMFKGSGFHINDYASNTAEPKSESKAEEAKPEPAKAEGCSGTPTACPACEPAKD